MKLEKYQQGKVMIYPTGCFLDFVYFLKYCRLIAVDLSKQKVLDTDPRVIEQIIFTGKAS